MNKIEIMIIAISLAMDSMTVAISKSLHINKKEILELSFAMGFFQGMMPVIGYFIANQFNNHIKDISNFISFIILFVVGLSMILKKDEKSIPIHNKIELLLLALATSIDALSIGVSFSITNTNIIQSSLIIGLITFLLSYLGGKIGKKIENKFLKNEKIGGIFLILIGMKILLKKKNI